MKTLEQIKAELKPQYDCVLTYQVNDQIFEYTEAEKKDLYDRAVAGIFELQKTEYAEQRQLAYPSTNDQWDILYHEGFDAWKAVIKEVKDRYPKP